MKQATLRRDDAPGDDHALVARIVDGDQGAFEQLMRRHNMALFRTARAILRDDADAEDALQEAYLAAYRHLSEFRGDARLSTWLTRIVINQALGRLRTRRRDQVVVELRGDLPDDTAPAQGEAMDEGQPETPETGAMREQMRRLLERKIDALPLAFRTAFILREVEEMTIEEAAECLAVPRRDGAHAGVSRPCAAARLAGRGDGRRDPRCLRLRRGALRSHRRRRARPAARHGRGRAPAVATLRGNGDGFLLRPMRHDPQPERIQP